VEKALEGIRRAGASGEVVVSDNGSTDRSVERARAAGARVVACEERGYGSALRRGLDEARGRCLVMGDGDDTYDFRDIPRFIAPLREGADLAMGSRFDGEILPGAMSWSHRWIGNPILSGLLRLFFGGGVSDAHCGLRAFTRDAYRRMALRTTGMEFASEMVIHALKKKMRIVSVPITYYPRTGESKLLSFRDAWRHTRFMLLYSPNHLFFLPGTVLFLAGFVLLILFLRGPVHFLGRAWDVHVALFSGILCLIGWQILQLGYCAKLFAAEIGLEESGFIERMKNVLTLERMLLLGLALFASGALMSLYIIAQWILAGFGFLSQVTTGVFALTLVAMGVQTVFNAFLGSMLQLKYRPAGRRAAL
jgi:glycosyltransferase involved in cell wall biosynthesis